MRALKYLALTLLAVVVALAVSLTAYIVGEDRDSAQFQSAIEPFYTPPEPLPAGKPGDIIRSEVITDIAFTFTGGTPYRILYYSTAPDGSQRVSSGMLMVPDGPLPESGQRPVVAYAHGTAGLGDSCAPSRDPATATGVPWVQEMLNLGWVVSMTDYVGVGTPGDAYYMIGKSEAADVVNSVRAARNFPDSHAGSRYIVFGQSQGGHSSLWTGELSKTIAPELDLIAVTATAPAAELGALMDQEWNTAIAWGIGPDVLATWPSVYPNLPIDEVTTEAGQKTYQEVAQKCIEPAILEGQLEELDGNQPFSQNPSNVPAWAAAIAEQTPPPLPASLPVFISQSTFDGVVLPNTIALLQQKWCAAGSNLYVNWLGQLATGAEAPLMTHQNEPLVAGPALVNWMQERFKGKAAVSNCGTVPPIAAAAP